MCQIRFTIQIESNSEPIRSAQGRYRLTGNVHWIDFAIDVNNPMTPDISTPGNYEMEVRVSYEAHPTTTYWSIWEATSFLVSANACDKSTLDFSSTDFSITDFNAN